MMQRRNHKNALSTYFLEHFFAQQALAAGADFSVAAKPDFS